MTQKIIPLEFKRLAEKTVNSILKNSLFITF